MKKQNEAFTLVELIVVITILAILGTIAFISLQGYSKSSRDSVRISDVSNMKTSLELFHLNSGKYPLPDNAEEVTYSGEIVWYQGHFGDTVVSNLSRNIQEVPTDPLSDKSYVFSTSYTRNEFQILNLLESDLVLNTLNQTNAAEIIRIPRVDGQYNGVYIKTASFIVPTPSLITAEEIPTGTGLILDNTNIKSQVITGGKNIPNIGGIVSGTGELNINLSVYNGTIKENSTDQEKINAMKAIQGAYTGSIIAGVDVYKVILSNTSDEDILAISDIIILDKTSYVTSNNNDDEQQQNILYASCNDILNNDSSKLNQDGVYTIDPDNNGIGFDVYCDMTDNGGGWTLVAIGKNIKTNEMFTSNATVGTVIDPNQNDYGKLSFETWNQIGNMTRWQNSTATTKYFSKHGDLAITLNGFVPSYSSEPVPQCSLNMINWSNGREYHIADCYGLGLNNIYGGWCWNGNGGCSKGQIMNLDGSTAWVK